MIVMLVGFMGAGKTTVGHIVAERLGLPFVDSDLIIEQRLGRSVRDVFAAEGEAAFRELEHQTVRELARGQDAVIALGGGALGDSRSRAALRHTRVIYLHVSFSDAMERVASDEFRPMLHRPDLREIYQARLPVYEEFAAMTIDTNGRRPDAVAMEILANLTTLPVLPSGCSSIFVTPIGGVYYAHVGPGLLAHVDDLLPGLPDAERAAIVEARPDRDVAAAVAAQLEDRGLRTLRIPVDDSAAAKTLNAYGGVVEALADHVMHKDDLVVAVGGESVGELAGFAAATFNRGTNLALVPTTLVAQADASVGGKNSINLSQGHNLVGSIHQPIVVVSDVQLACARADRAYRPGLAEIAKHALISDEDMRQLVLSAADRLRAGDVDAVQAVVTRSVEIKADIVSRDEREQGDRVYLNYGHTFANALALLGDPETGSEDAVLPLGLMAAAWLAYRQGRVGIDVVEAHRELLTALGLPTTGNIPVQRMGDAWARDKKYRRGVRFVVLNGLGRPEGGVIADDATLAQVFDDLRGSTTPAS